jgi:hypothetical protein
MTTSTAQQTEEKAEADIPRLVRPFDVPDAADHERLLTEDTEDLDEYPDCGLPRYTRLRLLKGMIIPTTVAMVEFMEYARQNDAGQRLAP